MTLFKASPSGKKAALKITAFLLSLCLIAGCPVTQASAMSVITPLTVSSYKGGYISGGEIPVSYINASSTLQENGYDHSPQNVCDKDTASDWCEGAYGRGQGEWIELYFGADVPVDSFVIYPGFWKTEKLFSENCRPASMTASFSDGSSVSFGFPDEMSPMTLALSRTVMTNRIRFTVDSVYYGSKYQDLCISEIQVFSNDAAYTYADIPNVYNVGSIMPSQVAYGSPVDLGGIIRTSVGVITEISCVITDSKGGLVSSSNAYPMSFEHSLNSSVINTQLKFGGLAKGNYTLTVSAAAVNGGNSVSGIVAVYPFTVGSAATGGGSSGSSALTPPTDYAYYGTAPFYGIWCEASKNYQGMVKLAQQWEARGYSPRIVITTDWSGLNKESWYALTPGVYYTQADAQAAFAAIQSIYPTAFIKYTDTHN